MLMAGQSRQTPLIQAIIPAAMATAGISIWCKGSLPARRTFN
jgi:hypothetical protein